MRFMYTLLLLPKSQELVPQTNDSSRGSGGLFKQYASFFRFTLFTLLAYLNDTPRTPCRSTESRFTIAGPGVWPCMCVARVPSRMPTVQADGVEVGEADSVLVSRGLKAPDRW